MSRGVNKVILIGRLGQDPEQRALPSGGAVTNFTMATSELWKDKESGQAKERSEWHRIVVFGRLSEICGQYLTKGSQVYIEGSLRTRQWEKDGIKRYTTEIVASDMQMLDSRGSDMPASSSQSAPSQSQAAPAGMDDFDDDIPF